MKKKKTSPKANSKNQEFTEVIKNKKKDNVILLVLIILLLMIVILLVYFKFLNRYYVDPTSDMIQNLYNFFDTSDISDCEGFLNYADKLIAYNDLTDKNKVCLAYQNTNLNDITPEKYKLKTKTSCVVNNKMKFVAEANQDYCEVSQVDLKRVGDTYLKTFNQEIPEVKEFAYDINHACYLKNDIYYCGYTNNDEPEVDNEITIYRKIKNALKIGNKIILYDYFLKIKNNECYVDNTSDIKNEDCTKAYKKLKDKEIDFNFIKKYGTTYKHVYKKNNANYYWLKTEKAK